MGLRILLLAPHPFFSERGTPIATRATLEVLAGEGHEIDVLTYHAGSDVAIDGVRLYRTRKPRLVRSTPIGPSWQKVLCDWVMVREAARMARARPYDLVHAIEEGSLMAWWLRRGSGTPYVYDMDSVLSQQMVEKGFPYRLFAPLFRALERLAVRRAVGVIAVCPAVADAARAAGATGPTVVLPDFPLRVHEAGSPPAGLLASPGPRLVYIGNLEAYQGIDLMIEAFRLIAADVPATLVIIGGDRASIERERRRAGDLAVSGRVRFLGPSDLRDLMAICGQADVLMSPRRLGLNTPMKIFNYMNSGRPILATRLPTHTQVLGDDTAMLVEPDPAAMADGMTRLLASAELRRRLGEQAQRLVREQYDEAAFRHRLAGFYRELEGGAPQRQPARS